MTRRVIDALAVLAGVALAAFAPFEFCHQGRCIACASGWLFIPPTFEGGSLLCTVNLQQLILRFIALAAVWWLARRIARAP